MYRGYWCSEFQAGVRRKLYGDWGLVLRAGVEVMGFELIMKVWCFGGSGHYAILF